MRLPEGSPSGPQATGVNFSLDGTEFKALNGGPAHCPFTKAISFFVYADTQVEIDRLWIKLTSDGGSPIACGWLEDKYGLSWQIVPPILGQLLADSDREKAGRVMKAMLGMVKLNIAALQAAADGS